MKHKFLTLLFVLSCFIACVSPEEKPFPKPKSYYRIDYPEKNYINSLQIENNFPYSFERPNYTQVAKVPGSTANDMLLVFPEFKADLIIKHLKIDTAFTVLTEKVKSDAYYHSFKANAIDEREFANPSANLYGVTYEITGNAACNYLFYLSDSVNQMITGELLIQSKPNYDSLQPTIDFIKSDIIHLIETFKWKN